MVREFSIQNHTIQNIMMTPGYNIRIKVEGKYLVGVTQDDVNITPVSKSSVTKDDAGIKKESIQAHDTEFSIAGLLEVSADGNTQLDGDDVIALAYLEGDSAQLDIEYIRASGAKYTGTGTIQGYSESSPADPDSDTTYSLNILSHDMALASNG